MARVEDAVPDGVIVAIVVFIEALAFVTREQILAESLLELLLDELALLVRHSDAIG